jgi:hypothetical protein
MPTRFFELLPHLESILPKKPPSQNPNADQPNQADAGQELITGDEADEFSKYYAAHKYSSETLELNTPEYRGRLVYVVRPTASVDTNAVAAIGDVDATTATVTAFTTAVTADDADGSASTDSVSTFDSH